MFPHPFKSKQNNDELSWEKQERESVLLTGGWYFLPGVAKGKGCHSVCNDDTQIAERSEGVSHQACCLGFDRQYALESAAVHEFFCNNFFFALMNTRRQALVENTISFFSKWKVAFPARSVANWIYNTIVPTFVFFIRDCSHAFPSNGKAKYFAAAVLSRGGGVL